jgi:hypothetical protein
MQASVERCEFGVDPRECRRTPRSILLPRGDEKTEGVEAAANLDLCFPRGVRPEPGGDPGNETLEVASWGASGDPQDARALVDRRGIDRNPRAPERRTERTGKRRRI